MIQRPRLPAPARALAPLALAALACAGGPGASSEGATITTTGEATTTATTLAAAGDPSTAGESEGEGATTGPAPPPARYAFFTPIGSTETYLIDRDAALVHAWESATPPAVSAFLLAGGDLLRTGVAGDAFAGPGAGGLLERRAWDGAPRWSFTYSSEAHRQHHDVEPLPDGHVLIVAWELRTPAEAIAAGRDPSTVDEARGLWPDTIVELDPETQAIVWEWRVWDHLIQDRDPDAPDYGDPADHPERVDLNHVDPFLGMLADWNHVNGIDYHPELDQILISAHHFNEIWIIDHATTTAEAAGHSGGARGRGGDLLYRWGNPAAHGAGDEGDRQLYYQHDPRWIPAGTPGAGDITIFNNGATSRPWSSVVQITPPLAQGGTYTREGPAYGPAAPTWEYVGDPPASFFSPIVGGAQRLPDGHTLITQGDLGRAFEVTPEGAIVWEHVHGGGVFRFDGFDEDHPALAGRDLTPIGPPP